MSPKRNVTLTILFVVFRQIDERDDRGLPAAGHPGQLQRRELGVQLLSAAAAAAAAQPPGLVLLRGRRRRQPGPFAEPTVAGPFRVRVHRELGRARASVRGRRRPEHQPGPHAPVFVQGVPRPGRTQPPAVLHRRVQQQHDRSDVRGTQPQDVRRPHRVRGRMVPRLGRERRHLQIETYTHRCDTMTRYPVSGGGAGAPVEGLEHLQTQNYHSPTTAKKYLFFFFFLLLEPLFKVISLRFIRVSKSPNHYSLYLVACARTHNSPSANTVTSQKGRLNVHLIILFLLNFE